VFLGLERSHGRRDPGLRPELRPPRGGRNAVLRWTFTREVQQPASQSALGSPTARLFLTSAALLFVELLLIRWIPANVIYVGFFRNFLLMASFLGIGLGIFLGRDGWRPRLPAFQLLLFGTVALVYGVQLNVHVWSNDELFFGLSERQQADVSFLVLPLVILLATALMASLALPLGSLFRSMPPLRAYAVDVAGAMAGIAAFAALSAAATPPTAWFLVVALLLALLGARPRLSRRAALPIAAVAATLFLVLYVDLHGEVWSPYYRINIASKESSWGVWVNGIPHQALVPIDSGKLEEFYEQPYRWFPDRTFKRVLVVGAGGGNDVAIALDRGASEVHAVEIDPEIQRIGVRHHPDRPYADPRVRVRIDDGRAFLRTTDERYDLIVFALPDSLTLVSTTANIRLESFLFTREAFASARDRLAPGGLFALYNFYREPWLVERFAAQLEDVFGTPPLTRIYTERGYAAAALAAGPAVAALGGAPPPGDTVTRLDLTAAPRPATDDWPFPYLRHPTIELYYLGALAFVLALAALALAGATRARGLSGRIFSPHFFVLGIAFLLLETRSLVTFSLLFGTTWIVNALVFFAILASVLAAILVNARWRPRDPRLLYLGLFASLAAAFVLPPAELLFEPAWLRYAVASVLTFAPVFCANLVFSYSFRDARAADMAFASNLLGAMVGGAIEYAALIVGYQALLPVVAALYLLAYLFATQWRVLSDRVLEAPAPVLADSAAD
jgi:hypothetical protein